MTITSSQILKVLNIFAWIIFVGLSIEACGFIVNTIAHLAFEPETAQRFWQQVDLTPLLKFDRGHFAAMAIYVSIVAILKALLFYRIVMLLTAGKLNMDHPFNRDVMRFMFTLSSLAFLIGVNCYLGGKYFLWLESKGVVMPPIGQLSLGGADVWIFMGVVLLVFAHIFKKGLELQTENELTV